MWTFRNRPYFPQSILSTRLKFWKSSQSVKLRFCSLRRYVQDAYRKLISGEWKQRNEKDKYSGEEDIKHIYRFQILPLRAIYIEGFPKAIDSIRHHPWGSGRPPSTDEMHPASEEHGLGLLDLLRRSSVLWLQSDAQSGSFDLKVEFKGSNG